MKSADERNRDRLLARYAHDMDEHKAKIIWVGFSIPTIVVADLEGALAAGLLISVVGWAASHWLALRG